MLKAIIFDFDYTLGDSTKGIALSINYALEQLGHPTRNVEEIKKTIGLSLAETYVALTKRKDADEIALFAKLFRQKADTVMVDHTELYPGVKEVLGKLKRAGYRTGIVTTKFHYRIEQILNKFGAVELIDLIVGAEDVKIEKPDPEGLLWTIGQMKLDRGEVLYVGDSLVDAKTAENAKVKFAAVLTGTTTKEEFAQHEHVLISEDILGVYQSVTNILR